MKDSTRSESEIEVPRASDFGVPAWVAPAMPIERCERVRKLPYDPSTYRMIGAMSANQFASTRAQADLAAARAADVSTHQKNAPAIAHNRAMREAIGNLMRAAGVADSFYGRDPNSRSRFPKSKRQEAGYLSDLRRLFPVDDGFAAATEAYEATKRRYDEFAAKVEQEKAARAAERDRERERRQADIEFAMLLIRYGLGPDATPGDLLNVIRIRSKYLDLAVAMEDVRGDWSEGCDAVVSALGRFTIDTDVDRQIAASVHEAVTGFHDDGDGRCFRDCEWNYGRLYEIAGQELAADAAKVRGMIDR